MTRLFERNYLDFPIASKNSKRIKAIKIANTIPLMGYICAVKHLRSHRNNLADGILFLKHSVKNRMGASKYGCGKISVKPS